MQDAYAAAVKDHHNWSWKNDIFNGIRRCWSNCWRTTDTSRNQSILPHQHTKQLKWIFDGDGTNDIDAKLTFALKSSSAPVEVKDLKDVVKTVELGTIADKEPATILAAINKANSSSLTDEDVTIEATSDTEATVTPKEGSKLVKGDAVTVKFKIGAEDKTVELNTIITEGTD
jgi:hypothetical protein